MPRYYPGTGPFREDLPFIFLLISGPYGPRDLFPYNNPQALEGRVSPLGGFPGLGEDCFVIFRLICFEARQVQG